MSKSIKNIKVLFLACLMTLFYFNTSAQVISCDGFTTYTQGGWGANPKGNNPGTILEANFSKAFPNGLTIGSVNKITLTSSAAVRAFLPQGSTARKLNSGTLVNPSKSTYSNVLAGQLVAATINAEMDRVISSFGVSATSVKDLKVAVAPFFDLTIAEVLAEANKFIGGSATNFNATDLNNILTKFNEGYHNGVNSNSIFACPITFTSSSSNVSCFAGSNGSISIANISGGAGAPYKVYINNVLASSTISNLTAGTYEIKVVDKIGLTSRKTIVITQPTLLTSSSSATKILCNGGTADVTVSANGGTAPYTGTGTFTVSAGTYSYTITDANGCTSTTEIVVTEPTLLTSSSSATKILCNGGTADVTVSANGGTAPYTGTGTFTVSAGTYSYTITDANGCTSTTEIVVTEPTLLTSSSSATKILCNGGTADVTVSANGGTAPYTGTGTFTVSAGTYSYTITDANGCTSTTEIVVTEPTALQLSGSTTNDESCNGGAATGTANVSVTGGVAPYTYLWSNAATTASVNAIAYNTILSVTVTDANGCTATFNFDTINCVKIVVPPTSCEALTTFTQGGWGAEPKGNNPGAYLHANFASAFPNGVTIGSGSNKATFTTAAAVTAFLPAGGSASSFSGTYVDPANTNFSVFAGQLLAASLNVGFDSYSASFGAGTNNLADMYCNFSNFYGVKVSDLLAEANLRISGITTTHTISQLNTALTKLNENYDNGTSDEGDFVCEVEDEDEDDDAPVYSNNTDNTNFNSFDKSINIYPNPALNQFNLSFNSNNDQVATVKVFNISGQVLFTESHSLTQGLNTINVAIDHASINSNILYVELNYNNTTARKVLMLIK